MNACLSHKEALEGFAHGRFETQSEIQRFLQNEEAFPKDKSGQVRFQRVTNMLKKVIYAGYITVPKWGITFQDGKHEPLISLETYQMIQDRLNAKARAPVRKDISNDFPLRGFVACGTCGKPMTACWSRGRTGRHAYYLCFGKGCPEYRKSIRRADVEERFEEVLKSLTPTKELFTVAYLMFEELWNDRKGRQEYEVKSLEKELNGIDAKVDQFLDQIVETDMPKVRLAYERKISDLESKKLVLMEKISKCGTALPDFQKTFRNGLTLLAKPYEYWAFGGMEEKVNVLRLCFADHLIYDRKSGFRTARTALPFSVIGHLKGGDSEMARPERFELPTKWFEATYSIQLSYGRVSTSEADEEPACDANLLILFRKLMIQANQDRHYTGQFP